MLIVIFCYAIFIHSCRLIVTCMPCYFLSKSHVAIIRPRCQLFGFGLELSLGLDLGLVLGFWLILAFMAEL